MKPTKRLIEALLSAAQRMEDDPACYNWGNANCCNCGILVQELLGINMEELYELRSNLPTMWGRAADTGYCSETGLPGCTIFKLLLEAGLQKEDFWEIESCGSARIGNREPPFDDPAFVVKYFRQLAERLQGERKASRFLMAQNY